MTTPFPQSDREAELDECRELFAIQIMVALTKNGDGPTFGTNAIPTNPWPWYAGQSVKAADALIAALRAKDGRQEDGH